MARHAKRWGERERHWAEGVQFPRSNEARASLRQQPPEPLSAPWTGPPALGSAAGWSDPQGPGTAGDLRLVQGQPLVGHQSQGALGSRLSPLLRLLPRPHPCSPQGLVLEVTGTAATCKPRTPVARRPSTRPLANQQQSPEAPPGSSAHAELSMPAAGSRSALAASLASGAKHSSRRLAGRIPPSNRRVGRRCRSPHASGRGGSQGGRVRGRAEAAQGSLRKCRNGAGPCRSGREGAWAARRGA